MKIDIRVKKLVASECASYSSDWVGINHYCCMTDCTCRYFKDTDTLPRCNYFERGVLPLDEKLQADYIAEQSKENQVVEKGVSAKPKPTVKCAKCEELFKANSNRQQYCEKCRKSIIKEQNRERQKIKRMQQL